MSVAAQHIRVLCIVCPYIVAHIIHGSRCNKKNTCIHQCTYNMYNICIHTHITYIYTHITYIYIYTYYIYIYIYILHIYIGTTGGLFVCGPKPMLEAISNVLETICFYLGNYITIFGNYIGKCVPQHCL